MQRTVKAGFSGMDQIEVVCDGGKIISSKVVGSLELLNKFKTWQKNPLNLPSGKTSEDLLLKELSLKIQDQWPLTNDEPELCHCRKIPQMNVERAVVLGAHSVEQVRARTSANTGCGTCLPDVERVLKAYLG